MTEQNPDIKELNAIVLGILDGLATILSPQIMKIINDRYERTLNPDHQPENE